MIDFLLRQGFDINSKNAQGQNALMLTLLTENQEAARSDPLNPEIMH